MLSGHFLAHRLAFLNLLFNKDNLDFWFDKLMDNFVLVGLFPEVNVLAIFFQNFWPEAPTSPRSQTFIFLKREIDKIRVITLPYLTSVSSTPFQGEPYCVCRTVLYLQYRYDNVTPIPLVLQLGLRIGPIQRMGAN